MKNRFIKAVVFSALTVILATGAIGFSYAYFSNASVAQGEKTEAGYLTAEVSMTIDEPGIPSDALAARVTVKKDGDTPVDPYTLALTFDEAATELCDSDFMLNPMSNLSLSRDDGGVSAAVTFTDARVTSAAGAPLVLVIDGIDPALLNSGGTDTLCLSLQIKGETLGEDPNAPGNYLVDGNCYQQAAFSITPQVFLVQQGGGH
ncbi:MAG: hypothetical protein FWF44_10575 [Defluviitaleaceae bacterium]|nr:hypothetical protein [Defluviitaleaceae bacterium]